MNPNKLVDTYLTSGWVMQLATVEGDQPWVCTVYFVTNSDRNFYWLSLSSRRHSLEIVKHHRAAIVIAIKLDQPVIGIQAEGYVTGVGDKEELSSVIKKYIKKYDIGHDFYEKFITGKNQHKMYKFTPDKIYLFDEVNYPGGKRIEIKLPQ